MLLFFFCWIYVHFQKVIYGVNFCGLLCHFKPVLKLNFHIWLASRARLCFGQNMQSDKQAYRLTGSGHTWMLSENSVLYDLLKMLYLHSTKKQAQPTEWLITTFAFLFLDSLHIWRAKAVEKKPGKKLFKLALRPKQGSCVVTLKIMRFYKEV